LTLRSAERPEGEALDRVGRTGRAQVQVLRICAAAWKRRMAIVVRVGTGPSVMILRVVEVFRQRPKRHDRARMEEACALDGDHERRRLRRWPSITIAVAGRGVDRDGAESARSKGREGQNRGSAHEMSPS